MQKVTFINPEVPHKVKLTMPTDELSTKLGVVQ